MRLQGGQKIWVQGRDQVVVVFLLVLGLESVPRQMINVPSVLQLYVREAQSDGTVGFGEKRDEEVGAEGNGSGYGGLDEVNIKARRGIVLG
jgi:hypothetical protein